MSHEIYKTSGFILGSASYKEADKVLFILTKDYGLIYTTVQGVRLNKSKHRYAVQDFSYSEFALVKGREYWRLTSSISDYNLHKELDEDKFRLIARVFVLIKRLVLGEIENRELYEIVEGAVKYLKETEMNEDELRDFECVLVLRILNNLGYVGDNKNLNFFIVENKYDNKVIEEMKKERATALLEINRALKESHL